MPRYTKNFQRDIMHKWADEGATLRGLSSEFKMSLTTLVEWKKNNHPEDWGLYREGLEKEKTQAAMAEVRKAYGTVVKDQLKDSIALRTLVRFTTTKLAEGLRDPGAKVDYFFAKSVSEMARAAKVIQDQQSVLFGIPNLRLDLGDAAKPLEEALGGRKLEDLDTSELIEIMLEAVSPEQNEGK